VDFDWIQIAANLGGLGVFALAMLAEVRTMRAEARDERLFQRQLIMMLLAEQGIGPEDAERQIRANNVSGE
jgi:hypothetical protein